MALLNCGKCLACMMGHDAALCERQVDSNDFTTLSERESPRLPNWDQAVEIARKLSVPPLAWALAMTPVGICFIGRTRRDCLIETGICTEVKRTQIGARNTIYMYESQGGTTAYIGAVASLLCEGFLLNIDEVNAAQSKKTAAARTASADDEWQEPDEEAEKLRIKQSRYEEQRAQFRALKRANGPIPE